MADDPGSKPYFSRGLATAAAVLSLLSTVLGGVSAYFAAGAKEKAEAAYNNSKLTKDYQIQVFQMVDRSLSKDGGGLALAAAYVTSLDNPDLQAALTQA